MPENQINKGVIQLENMKIVLPTSTWLDFSTYFQLSVAKNTQLMCFTEVRGAAVISLP